MFWQSVAGFKHKPALLYMGTTITYKELGKLVQCLVDGLLRLGIKKGDRVGLCLPNCPHAVIAYYAILSVGGIVVPCNPKYTRHELTRQLQNAGARMVFVWDERYTRVRNSGLQEIVLVQIEGYMPLVKKLYYRFFKKSKLPKIPVARLRAFRQAQSEIVLRFSDLLKIKPSEHDTVAPTIRPEDTAMLQYTGGTTGISKGAELMHQNLMANINQLQCWFSAVQIGEERFITALPLFHIFALTTSQNLCIAMGGVAMLVPDPMNPKLIREMMRMRPTICCLVPPLWDLLSRIASKAECKYIKYAVSGGVALPPALIDKCRGALGVSIIEGYGMSEMSPVSHCNLTDGAIVPGSIGLPLPGTDAKICDENGNEVSEGELWVKGPQVMKGYWQNEEETKIVLTADGWLRTGDVVRMDERGYFYLVDRIKDMIALPNGLKVFPSEVEDVIRTHPAVNDVALVGIPSKDGEFYAKAFVVLREGAELRSADIIRYCKETEQLAPHKIPRKVEFCQEIPKTILGKPMRRMLRDKEQAKE